MSYKDIDEAVLASVAEAKLWDSRAKIVQAWAADLRQLGTRCRVPEFDTNPLLAAMSSAQNSHWQAAYTFGTMCAPATQDALRLEIAKRFIPLDANGEVRYHYSDMDRDTLSELVRSLLSRTYGAQG